MPDRSALTQIVQVGFETTPGTLVAATKRFSAARIRPRAMPEIEPFRPDGSLYPTITMLNSERSEAEIEGKVLYDEIVVFLSSIVKTAVVSQPVGFVDAYLWTFEPNGSGGDTVKTLTVEAGDAIRAVRFGYGLVNSLTLSWTKGGDGVSLSGSMIGQILEQAITLTPSGSVVRYPERPVYPRHVSVYRDIVAANMGDTKLLRAFSAEFSLEDRFAGVYPLNEDVPSFDGHIESEPTATLSLGLGADVTGETIAYSYQTGQTQYIQIEARGEEIDTGVATSRERITLQCAAKVTDPGDYSDEDGVWVIPPTFALVNDSVFGRPFRFEVVNRQATL